MSPRVFPRPSPAAAAAGAVLVLCAACGYDGGVWFDFVPSTGHVSIPALGLSTQRPQREPRAASLVVCPKCLTVRAELADPPGWWRGFGEPSERAVWRLDLAAACKAHGLEGEMIEAVADSLCDEPRDERTAFDVVADELDSWSPGDSE